MTFFSIAAMGLVGVAAVAAAGTGYILSKLPVLDLENEIDTGEEISFLVIRRMPMRGEGMDTRMHTVRALSTGVDIPPCNSPELPR